MNGFLDDFQIMIQGRAKHARDVTRRGLGEDGYDFSAGSKKGLYIRIVLNRRFRVTRTAERHHRRVLELQVARPAEEIRGLRVRTRLPALDVADSEGVQLAYNSHLVLRAELDAGALRAIAKGHVVNVNSGGHCRTSPVCYRSRICALEAHDAFERLDACPNATPGGVLHHSETRFKVGKSIVGARSMCATSVWPCVRRIPVS